MAATTKVKSEKAVIPKPEPLQFFHGDSVSNWTAFKEQWETFEEVSGLSLQSSTERVVTFLRVVGKDAINVYNSFSWVEEKDSRDIDKVIEKFEGLCLLDKSTRYQRYVFHKREQEVGESIDEFVADVKALAMVCDFGAMRETLITDKIIFGMKDRTIREKMLKNEETQCEKVLELIQKEREELEKELRELLVENESKTTEEAKGKMSDEIQMLDEVKDDYEGEGDYETNDGENGGENVDELIIKADSDIEDVPEEEPPTETKSQEKEQEEEVATAQQTKRDTEFTSEAYKIEINGLPNYFGVGQLKKLLNETLQLKAHKVKPPASNVTNKAYVTFRDLKSRDRALAVLDEYVWKKCTLTAKIAEAVADPITSKGGEILTDIIVDPDDKTPVNEKVVKSVTPLFNMTYEEQLEQKKKSAHAVLRKLGNEMSKTNNELEQFVRFHKLRRKGHICEVDEIKRSPEIDAYRNKCEFTIGTNPENELPTVGFRVSSYKAGSVAVAPVAHLAHITDIMKKVVEVFEEYVRNSEHKPFCPITHEGVWRQLTVRTSSNGDILIAVVIHPQEFSEDELGDIKQSIVDYFKDGGGSSVGVTSIFYQAFGQRVPNPEEQQFEHLWGEEYMTETVLGKHFRISCESFFQVNTKACEVLYETVAELAELDGTSVILDICCGTGTIGISLADQCLKVYGIEMVKQAAEDARQNAETNGLENVAIYTGKVEVNLAAVLSQVVKYTTIGVVDPPRAGLSESVVRSLRKCENMNRLIYLSCDPEGAGAFKNFIDLSRPKSKNYKGEFFVPIRASIVDMFPHTPHYELIIVFERWEERKWRRIMEGNPLPRDEEYFKRIPAKPDVAFVQDEEEEADEDTGYGSWKSVAKRKRMEENEARGRKGNRDRHGQRSHDNYQYGGNPQYGRNSLMGETPYDNSYYGGSSYDRFYANSMYDAYASQGYGMNDPYRLSRQEYDAPYGPYGSYGSMGGGAMGGGPMGGGPMGGGSMGGGGGQDSYRRGGRGSKKF